MPEESNVPTGSPGSPRPPVQGAPASPPPPPSPPSPPASPGGGPPMHQAPPPYAYYPPPPPQRDTAGRLLKILTSGIILSLLLSSLIANLYMFMLLSSSFSQGVQEIAYSVDGETDDRVVILPVNGGIDSTMADYVKQAVKALEDDPPAAIVLRVESGGGGVTPSDQIWHYLTDYQARMKAEGHDVPIVASFGGVAASGGYYIAAPAAWIVAEPTCITGSIGVLAQVPTLGGLMDKVGVDVVVMEADGSPSKELANNMFRDWTEEDRAIVRNLLNAAYEQFVEVVHAGRTDALGKSQGISEERVRELASGSVYTAQEAMDKLLVDQLGYLDDAVIKAANLGGLPTGKRPKVTVLHMPTPFGLGALLGIAGDPPARLAAGADPLAGLESLDPDRVRTWVDDVTQLRLAYRMNLR